MSELYSWQKKSPVADAQKLLPDKAKMIFSGVDTDALLNQLDRYDDCHFSGSGQGKFSDVWISVLKDNQVDF